jgi:hypothetical protein
VGNWEKRERAKRRAKLIASSRGFIVFKAVNIKQLFIHP